MALLLSLLSIVIGIAGIFTYQWITLFPGLGIGYLYHIRWVNWGFRVVSVGLALAAYAISPSGGQIWVLGIALLLAAAAGLTRANRVLVALDRPQHQPSGAAALSDNAPVLGLAHNGESHAWPLAILVPHHLANDQVGGEAVLAGW